MISCAVFRDARVTRSHIASRNNHFPASLAHETKQAAGISQIGARSVFLEEQITEEGRRRRISREIITIVAINRVPFSAASLCNQDAFHARRSDILLDASFLAPTCLAVSRGIVQVPDLEFPDLAPGWLDRRRVPGRRVRTANWPQISRWFLFLSFSLSACTRPLRLTRVGKEEVQSCFSFRKVPSFDEN